MDEKAGGSGAGAGWTVVGCGSDASVLVEPSSSPEVEEDEETVGTELVELFFRRFTTRCFFFRRRGVRDGVLAPVMELDETDVDRLGRRVWAGVVVDAMLRVSARSAGSSPLASRPLFGSKKSNAGRSQMV